MHRRMFLALPLATTASSSALYTRLHSAIERITTFDTHEHFPSEALRLASPPTFFDLVGHYTANDLISAGLGPDAQKLLADPKASTSAKWAAFEPLWKYVRNTGYGQALQITARDLYGVSAISRQGVSTIDAALGDRNKPGIYRSILTRSKIRFVLNDAVVDPADGALLLPSRRFDHLVLPHDLKLVERLTDVSITNLAALEGALTSHFERAVQSGMRAVKCALAYHRDLRFDAVGQAEASRAFDQFLTQRNPEPPRSAVDFLFHHLIRLCDEHGVPVQMHTGMLSSNGAEVERTRPGLLVNVFQQYPRVRFDLFHTGYPYQHEFTALVKQFPNLYADFCWTHIVSPANARQTLREMLDAVPANKIFAFGGDYRYPELSYAHLVIARRNLATVLAERVELRLSTEEEAAELARWLLYDNPARLFLAENKR